MHSPIFPLNTVLFPGGRIPLQIFEPRYMDMVKNCLKQDMGFTVVLIREGTEVGTPAQIFDVGTHGNIVDWTSLENGLLGITVEGEVRVRILETQRQTDNLLTGEQHILPEQPIPDSEQIEGLASMLKQLRQHPLAERLGGVPDYQDPTRVIWELCQLLPFPNAQKQALLESDDPHLRLRALEQALKELEG